MGDDPDVNLLVGSAAAGIDYVLEVDAGSSTVGINCDPLDAKGAALVVSGDASITGQLKAHLGVGLKNGNSLHWDNENTRIIASHSSDYMNFDVGGYSEILHIEGDGRKVGIGGPWNTNPEANLQVSGDASITGEFRTNGAVGINGADPDSILQINNANSSSYRFGYGGTSDVYLDADDVYFRSDNGGVNDMVKKGTRLGIGHTAPSGLLHLRGSNTAKIILENTDNATNIDIDYYSNGDAVQSRIRYGEGPGAFYFHPNASSGSAVSMLYDGKVGIGTASPGSLLEVY